MNIQNVPLDTLKPYTRNAKLHTEQQIKQVAESIKRFGWVQPIVIDKDNNVIIGHCRIESAKLLGQKEVPTVMVDNLTNDEIKALRIADNKLNESEWNVDLVNEEVELLPLDLQEITGWDLEVDIYEDKTEEQDNSIPEVKESIAQLGDIYQLGNHRVMCGDSTKIEDVERLMDGKKVDMVFTDPPYGVDYESRGSHNEFTKIENDNLSETDFNTFLTGLGSVIQIVLKDSGAIYLCHGDTGFNAIPFYDLFKHFNWKRSSSIIWVKNVASMGWQDYRNQHEVISYGWKKDKPYFIDDRYQTTTWEIDRDNVNQYIHPTQKPVALAEKATQNSSKINEICLDLFLGSGSTLIACEKTNRICYGMEIDPHYVDVIIKRWEDYTGKKAVKL